MSARLAIVAAAALAGCGRIGFDALTATPDGDVGSGTPRLAVGLYHACVVRPNGELYCWGDNGDGQLGLGAGELGNDMAVPTLAAPGHVWRDIALGERHTCALDDQGVAWCWGSNANGQLGLSPLGCGDGTVTVPETCDDTGTANGDGCDCMCNTGATAPNVLDPTALPGPVRFRKIFAEKLTTCAIATDAALWCWGRNGAQQLGVGDNTDRGNPSPVMIVAPQVGNDHAWSQVGVGDDHNCAVQLDGSAWCMGANASGELGQDGSVSIVRNRPEVVVSAERFSEVESGIDMTCGITTANALACWGRNDVGQLGVGDLMPRNVPTLADPGPWRHLGVGDTHGCAIRDDGTAACWGDNANGALGDGAAGGMVTMPKTISGSYVEIEGGTSLSCALDAAGGVWCWGLGSRGQIGNGAMSSVNVPTPVGAFGGS